MLDRLASAHHLPLAARGLRHVQRAAGRQRRHHQKDEQDSCAGGTKAALSLGYHGRMEVYLVGGAVRDRLLGLPVGERDWVVVGARPEELERQGYLQVGKEFPVFLHPDSREEYALARTERKVGPGYKGFTTQFSPDVTLEDDLRRRDLTINAIAEDADGTLIDPFGGQRDLDARVLRHVSGAFVEDPVRVLRLARFAARFASLGFTVADETADLMKQIVDRRRDGRSGSRARVERNPARARRVATGCVLPGAAGLRRARR